MKILDPQSAVLTTAEVHHFLTTNPARPSDKPIGGYPPVDLTGYRTVRKEFEHYTRTTSPHILTYPPPERWMGPVIARLKALGLTKPEALTLINLGIGLNQPNQKPATNGGSANDNEADIPMENGAPENGDHEETTNGHLAAEKGTEEEAERDDSLVLAVVIEELDARFNEEQQKEILSILRQHVTAAGGE